MVNDLMDLERAAQHRFSVAAALARTPSLEAELVLGAAQHESRAQWLHEVVIELRGTPHSGETTAILADPLWFSPPAEGQSDQHLIDACIAEEESLAARFEAALRAEELPERAHGVVRDCIAVSAACRRRLLELKASVGEARAAAGGTSG
jgi:hypothetical protein